MNKILLLLLSSLCCAFPALASRSLTLSGSQAVSFPIPTNNPYASLGSYRVEFRIHGFALTSENTSVYWAGVHYCMINEARQLRCVDGASDPNLRSHAQAVVDLTGRTDVRVRTQSDIENKRWTMEVWNGDGTGYVLRTVSLQNALPANYHWPEAWIGSSAAWTGWRKFTGAFAFLRWSSSLVALGSRPPADAASGNLLSLELENNLQDSSGKGLNGSISGGGAQYGNVPGYPPRAEIRANDVVRAGSTALLDARTSFSTVGAGTPDSFEFQQVSGPEGVEFRESETGTTEVALPLAGTYKFRVTVKDSVGAAEGEIEIGAVATDNKGVVIYPDEGTAFLLGPMTMWGKSPWQFFDVTDRKVADTLGPAVPPLAQGQVRPGTVAINPAWTGPAYIEGTGTQFTREFGCAGVLQNAITASETAITVQADYGSAYQVNQSIQIGSEFLYITAIAGDTLTVERGRGGTAAAAHAAGDPVRAVANVFVHWNPPGEPEGSGKLFVEVSRSQNCTDTRLYLSEYYYPHPAQSGLTYSRVAGAEILNIYNYGYAGPGGTYNWNYYDNVVSYYRMYYRTGLTKYRDWARALADTWWLMPLDHGMAGIVPRVGAAMGIMLRAIDGRPEWWPGIKRYVDTQFNGWVLFQSCSDCAVPARNVYEPRESGYATLYMALLAKLHPDAAVRDESYTKVKNAVMNYWLPKQRISDDELQNGEFWTFYTQNPAYGQGSQPFMHAWPMLGLLYTREVMLERGDTAEAGQVQAAVERAAQFLWNTRDQRRRGLYYTVHYNYCSAPGDILIDPIRGFRSCDSGCGDIAVCNRSLLNTVIGPVSWLYRITGNPVYRDYAEEWFAANFGGPDGGSNSMTKATGPLADGKHGELGNALPSCASAAPPCGGDTGPSPKGAKDWAQGTGAAGAGTHLGHRLGGVDAPSNTTAQFAFQLADFAPADRARVTVIQPSGKSQVVNCAASPCALPVDARQGDHMVRVEYLDSGGRVVNKAKARRMKVCK